MTIPDKVTVVNIDAEYITEIPELLNRVGGFIEMGRYR